MSAPRATNLTDGKFAAILSDVRHGFGIHATLHVHKVSPGTFYSRLDRCEEDTKAYSDAIWIGLDRLAERALLLASTTRPGVKTKRTPQPDLVTTDKNGRKRRRKRPDLVEVTTGDMVERSRLELDTIKWYLAKRAPKKYGDRLELGGELTTKVVRVKDLTGTKRDG